MEKVRWLFTMCCIVALLSCRESQEDSQLLDSIEQAWQLCESSLPEACERAEVLKDSVQASSEYVRQKYNLLTIRLRDKYDMVPSSPDSSIQVMAYFERHGIDADRERACYYVGSAYRDLKDYPRAVSHFLRTVDEARQSRCADTLIWQNALSQLRFLYMLQLNYEEELTVALQAVEMARQSKKNQVCYLMDVASAYADLGDTLSSLQYLDTSYRILKEEHFPSKYGRILMSMLTTYSNYNHFEKTESLRAAAYNLPTDLRPQNYELCLAKYYENACQTDSAIVHYRNYYDKAKEASGRYEASAGLQRCYMREGDFKQAALWGCLLHETNDSVIAQRAFEETQRARDAYIYYRDKEKEQAIMQRDAYIIFVSIIGGLALLCIVMGLLAFYSFRKKKFVEEIIDKDKKLKSVREEIRKRQEELNIAMKELEQRTMINRELTRIALMDNVTDKAEDIVTHFRNVVSGHAKLRDDAWKELMSAIETLYPGFLEKVQGRLKKQMREPQLRTICLMKIGLKPMQIARVMDQKIQTVWNRVKRAEAVCGDLLDMSL